MACNQQETEKYPYDIGFIPEETAIIIDSGFAPCDTGKFYSYYNRNAPEDIPAGFVGGPKAIKRFIEKEYPDLDLQGQSGLLTIRFMINCEGRTDRFEIFENDLDYQPMPFKPEVKQRLFEIHLQLAEWRPIYIHGEYRDCFMYITYRLKDGKITEILP